MAELLTFVHLGFRHVTGAGALDHILFLLALAAIYQGRSWRNAAGVVTAFTIGHSLTLALAVTGAVRLPTPLIEFLIPVTIVLTGLGNMAGSRARPLLAGTFGLVHGAGFANYLSSLFTGPIALPLFGFNVGIELGQIVVLAIAGVALAGVDRVVARLRSAPPAAVLRVRTVAVSAAVVAVAVRMAAERLPW